MIVGCRSVKKTESVKMDAVKEVQWTGLKTETMTGTMTGTVTGTMTGTVTEWSVPDSMGRQYKTRTTTITGTRTETGTETITGTMTEAMTGTTKDSTAVRKEAETVKEMDHCGGAWWEWITPVLVGLFIWWWCRD